MMKDSINSSWYRSRSKRNQLNGNGYGSLSYRLSSGDSFTFGLEAFWGDEAGERAAQRLADYTRTAEYAEKLRSSAVEIAKLFEGRQCVLYLSERDMGAAEELEGIFMGSAEVRTDRTIKIGGVKGYCAEMGIIADETLDSKLEAQREWFVENATLSVL